MSAPPTGLVTSKNQHEVNPNDVHAPQLSQLQDRSASGLRPWPNNPRTHSDRQLVKLKASIRQFGFTTPVIVDEHDVILSGHGRVQAALSLGLAAVPVRVLSGLSASQKRAYVLADNKLAELSRWDTGLLKSELELLIDTDFEVELTGFSTTEIDLMFEAVDPKPAIDPDETQAADLEVPLVCIRGDLWLLGEHRVFCGDSLLQASYQTLLASQALPVVAAQSGDVASPSSTPSAPYDVDTDSLETVQMVFTDPPYNVPIAGHVCGKGTVKHDEFAMASGEMSAAEFTTFLQTVLGHMAAVSEDGSIHYICMDWRHLPELQAASLPVYGPMRQLCVWVKDNAGMGTFYRSQHELVCVYRKGEGKHINNFELGQHGRYRTNVWHYPGVNSFRTLHQELLKLHPTVKPVSLIADAIRDCSHRKGIVLDPFGGSGSTLIAAERTGRRARLIEYEPKYVDVTIQRWQRVTGKTAVLARTGQTWAEVQQARHGSAGGCVQLADEDVGSQDQPSSPDVALIQAMTGGAA